MMRCRWLLVGPLVAVVAVAGCAGAQAQADDESLRDSFAKRIETSSFVSDFSRNGDELTFSGTLREGGTAEWRVVIDSSVVEPNELDDAMPYVGRITSGWYANGQVVEYLGSMSALPQEVLDRGLGQECYAYWLAEDRRWDW